MLQFLIKSKKRSRLTKAGVSWYDASDIFQDLQEIVTTLNLKHINLEKVKVFRSSGSQSRARARIWAFPRIWQQALNLPPHYIIEVLSEKFDHLSADDKKRVLIHELLHIPKNFSGSLVSHRGRYHRINSRSVEQLFNIYKSNIK